LRRIKAAETYGETIHFFDSLQTTIFTVPIMPLLGVGLSSTGAEWRPFKTED